MGAPMKLTEQQKRVLAFLDNKNYTPAVCEKYYRETPENIPGNNYTLKIRKACEVAAYIPAIDDLIKAVTNAPSGQREGLADDGGDGINQGQECIPPAPPERENREAKNEKGVQENAIQSTVRRKATGRRKNPRFKIG